MNCIVNRFISTLTLIFTALIIGISCQLPQQVTVHIAMDEAGMHRKLEYTVQYGNPISNMDCGYMLAQSLPAAVYISTDELDDLQRLQMLNAVYPKFVDIEKITEKSESFTVLLRASSKGSETMTLPIHFRYHAASLQRTKVNVAISLPKLYVNCATSTNNSTHSDLLANTEKFYCLNEQNSRFEERDATEEDCSWQEVLVKYQLKMPLEAEIPVGNANRYAPVLYATIALSWAAFILTVLSTHSVPRRINKQLNEQRLAQQSHVKTK